MYVSVDVRVCVRMKGSRKYMTNYVYTSVYASVCIKEVHLRVVGHVVAKEKNTFSYWGGIKENTLYRQ